ncbi:hypothetical protein [Streptomyces sirii]|uniref:hypothetical protein n=1 Tax=Streptomyces sirii TaxID=3127701 RepID=UPI003D36B3B8
MQVLGGCRLEGDVRTAGMTHSTVDRRAVVMGRISNSARCVDQLGRQPEECRIVGCEHQSGQSFRHLRPSLPASSPGLRSLRFALLAGDVLEVLMTAMVGGGTEKAGHCGG